MAAERFRNATALVVNVLGGGLDVVVFFFTPSPLCPSDCRGKRVRKSKSDRSYVSMCDSAQICGRRFFFFLSVCVCGQEKVISIFVGCYLLYSVSHTPTVVVVVAIDLFSWHTISNCQCSVRHVRWHRDGKLPTPKPTKKGPTVSSVLLRFHDLHQCGSGAAHAHGPYVRCVCGKSPRAFSCVTPPKRACDRCALRALCVNSARVCCRFVVGNRFATVAVHHQHYCHRRWVERTKRK